MQLPDINFWLALAFQAHAHHTESVAWFEQVEADSCTFCRVTQAGFLRLGTNPAVFGDEALTMSQAWSVYDTLLSDARVSYMPEPEGLESFWRALTVNRAYSSKVWMDAYLTAFAMAGSQRVVTFDRSFRAHQPQHAIVLGCRDRAGSSRP